MYHVYMIVKEKRKSTLKEAQFIFFFHLWSYNYVKPHWENRVSSPLNTLFASETAVTTVFNSGINTQKHTNTICKAYISALFFITVIYNIFYYLQT